MLAARKSYAPPAVVPAARLEAAIADRLSRVEELGVLRAEAEKLGVRVYLFGGLSASFGNYVRSELLKEAGDARFRGTTFDYALASMVRASQDLDLVIDGSAEEAEALESLMAKRFPYRHGTSATKSAWEIRPLREARGDKEALLGSEAFRLQHTDTMSTTLIEVTTPARRGSRVRDVRDFDSKRTPAFLDDLSRGVIHYLFSPEHEKTDRAKQGKNPPIISAIRVLTKAIQNDLELPPEDLAKVKEIVAAFDPVTGLTDDYARRWVESNGRKLFENAWDLEKAWKLLDESGLREKLILAGDASEKQSLAWWLSRSPLPSSKIGKGKEDGKPARTAKQLGITVVAHKARDTYAYQSMAFTFTGEPNFFVSRDEGGIETTAVTKGRSAGLSVDMAAAAAAREGVDFTVETGGIGADGKVKPGAKIVWKNRAALRVLAEPEVDDPVVFFERLSEADLMSGNDTSFMLKLRQKMKSRLAKISPAGVAAISSVIEKELEAPAPRLEVLREWFSLPLQTARPDLLEKAIALKEPELSFFIARNVLSAPEWAAHPRGGELLRLLLATGQCDYWIGKYILPSAEWKANASVRDLRKKPFADAPAVEEILAVADPKARVAKLKALDWGTLPPEGRLLLLEQARETGNSYETAALVALAGGSGDRRWLPLLDGWIKSWRTATNGWRPHVRREAALAVAAIKKSPDCDLGKLKGPP